MGRWRGRARPGRSIPGNVGTKSSPSLVAAAVGLAMTVNLPVVRAEDPVAEQQARSTTEIIETAAISLARQVDLPSADRSTCPADQLVVRYSLPEDATFEAGAHFEPLGPPPDADTTEVNGVVTCGDATVAYLGFEAWLEAGRWNVVSVPDPGPEPDHGDEAIDGLDPVDPTIPDLEPRPGPPPSDPSNTPRPPAPGSLAGFDGLAVVRSVDSTSYCLPGTMANGQRVHDGAVAMNGVPFRLRWRVLDGPRAGRVFEVKDRIGHSSEFDMWTSSCETARLYGRHQIRVAIERYAPVIEAYAPYDAQRTCDPTAKPGVMAFAAMLLNHYPVSGNSGIARACHRGRRSEHKEGRAFDWSLNVDVPAERTAAEDTIAWLLATDEHGNRHAMARRLGIMYMIWDGQIWSAYRASTGWRPYHGVSTHRDHVHFSFSWAGARGETSFWGGSPPDPVSLRTPSPTPTSERGSPAPPGSSTAVPPNSTTTSPPSSDDDRDRDGGRQGRRHREPVASTPPGRSDSGPGPDPPDPDPPERDRPERDHVPPGRAKQDASDGNTDDGSGPGDAGGDGSGPPDHSKGRGRGNG